MAMVAAVEFHDVVALREATCHADRRHGGLGARGGHAHLFHRGHPLADRLRHIDLVRIRNTEGNAVLGDLMDRVCDRNRSVAEDVRPPRADVVDVGLVIDVGDAAALRPADEERLAIDVFESTHRAVHAPRDVLLGDGEKFAG